VTNIVIITKQYIYRLGIEAAFSIRKDFKLTGALESIEDVPLKPPGNNVGILIVDFSEYSTDLSKASTLKSLSEHWRVLAICGANPIDVAIKSLEAGASGILTTSFNQGDLFEALSRIVDGENYLHQSIAMNIVTALQGKQSLRKKAESLGLSHREKQIADRIKTGMTNLFIASELGLSERTVKHYVTILKEKLCVDNRTQIALSLQRLEI
jgi:two-component system, NarL family, nitrate/nitrite response regulator NarL